MQTILVTGANRGIGLELTRQYAAAGARVHACCRNPDAADALRALASGADGRVAVHRLDVARPEAVEGLAAELDGEAIDLLVSNAGAMHGRGGIADVDVEEWVESFRVNTIGPWKLAAAFTEHVARSERRAIVIVTSRMGSIADNTSGGYYPYRTSKAAVNMVARSLSIDLHPRGIACAVIHPGWVRTDMGGPSARISAEESVEGMRRVMDGLGLEQSGRFFNYDGSELPW